MTVIGWVGLGNMGSALAANVVRSGSEVLTFDVAGPANNPAGATFQGSLAGLARNVDVILLSLPDGATSTKVISEVVATGGRRVTQVIDTSTVGIVAAEANAEQLGASGLGFLDAAVSGGPSGARARTLLVMYAASDTVCEAVEPVLASLSDRLVRVGDRPGMAQAAKLANNFLSATALAATSEAIAFAESAGIDMATMLSVLNAASGQSAATTDKFPNHVLTERYASGFTNTLMAKDLSLYVAESVARGRSTPVSETTAAIWERFAREQPHADFTRIYPFVEGLS